MSRIIAPQWTNRRRRGHGLSRRHAERLKRDYAAPLEYPTDLVCFFDARTLALSDGASVSTWADESSNGNDLSQGTGANQPTYRASGINSLPAVEFDGSSDVLTSTSFGSEWSGSSGNPVTFVAVLKLPNASGGSGYMWGPGNSGDDNEIFHPRDLSSDWGFHARGDGGGNNYTLATHEGTDPQVVSWRYTSGEVVNRVDHPFNDTENTGSDEGAKTFDQFGLGALFRTGVSNHAAFTIAMLAAWSKRLDYPDLNDVERWMGDAYGIDVV